MDSLQKGYKFLQDYEKNILASPDKAEERYFILKDAILSIHHAIEILFKSILFKHSEYLIFSEMNKYVKNAYVEKRNKNLASIFETSLKDKIHTVTFEESINRVETVCGNPLEKDLKDKINQLNAYRNLIIHSEIFLNENDINDTFDEFIDKLDIYFYKVLGKEYKRLSGYSELSHNYEKYKESLTERKSQWKAQVIEKFISSFEKTSISMGCNEVKIIKDINVAMKIIKELEQVNVVFGIDMYDYSCSGKTEIRRYDQNKISFFTYDNNADFIFTFKSMLIYIPLLENDLSPILFFESDKMEIEDRLQPFIETNYHQKKQLSGIYFVDDKKEVYDPKELHAFEERLEYDENFVVPNYYRIEKHIDPVGIFGFANIQGLRYRELRTVLDDFKDKSLVELATEFKRS